MKSLPQIISENIHRTQTCISQRNSNTQILFYSTKTNLTVTLILSSVEPRHRSSRLNASSSSDCVSSQWVPEISHHCPRTPFLLVGTQVDLRDDSNTLEKLAKNKQRALTCESGEKLARELKAVKYVECSALTQVRREAGCLRFYSEKQATISVAVLL